MAGPGEAPNRLRHWDPQWRVLRTSLGIRQFRPATEARRCCGIVCRWSVVRCFQIDSPNGKDGGVRVSASGSVRAEWNWLPIRQS
jgi:hypothetical protein